MYTPSRTRSRLHVQIYQLRRSLSPDGRICIYMILAMIRPRRHLAILPRPAFAATLRDALPKLQWRDGSSWLRSPAAGFPQSSAPPASPATAPPAPRRRSRHHPRPRPSPIRAARRKRSQAGRRAEQSGDWKAAFADYSEASAYASVEPGIRDPEGTRPVSSDSVLDRSARSARRIAGNIPGARALLTQALEIDPNYVVARERLAELTPRFRQKLTPESGPRGSPDLPRSIPSPERCAFDYRGTTRGAYEEIGRQFGVKMVFDGDLPDRVVRFQVPERGF